MTLLQLSDLKKRLSVVYAIFYKVDGACLYVSRTNSLQQHLYTKHLSESESNIYLKKYLIEDLRWRDIDTMAAANFFNLPVLLSISRVFRYMHARTDRKAA